MAHFLLDDDKPIKNGETHKPPKNGGLVDFQGKTMVCKRYFLSKHAYLSMRKQLQFRDVLYYTHQKPWKTKKNTTSGGSNESPYDIFPLQPSSTSSTVPAPPPRGLVHHRLGIRQHLCPGVLEVLIRELGIHASARLGRIERAAKAGERCVQWLPGFSGGVGGCGVGLGSVFEIIYIYILYIISIENSLRQPSQGPLPIKIFEDWPCLVLLRTTQSIECIFEGEKSIGFLRICQRIHVIYLKLMIFMILYAGK